jgi:beta-lactamase class A
VIILSRAGGADTISVFGTLQIQIKTFGANIQMTNRLCCAALLLLLSLSTFAQSAKPAAPTAATLDARIKSEVATFKGKVFLFAKNLDSGATYSFNGDEKVRTASTIKTAIMVEAFARVAEGKAKWSDELVLTTAKKVSGSGILQELSDGLKLMLRDGVNLMMVVSDNTATNLVLDVLTTDAVNARMDSLGLKNTRSLRKIGGGGESAAGKDSENKKYGLGVTTPREMVSLMEKLEGGEVISREASKEMLALMKREQGHNGIGRTLNGIQMATKSGALDALRSNVGIIYSKRGRIAMAITCDNMPDVDWTADNAGYLMLSRLSQLLIDGLGK